MKALHVPAVFFKFLSALKIDFNTLANPADGTVATSGDISTFARGLDCSLDEIAIFCLQFLEGICGSDDIDVHLSLARNLDNPTRRLLKDTILVDEMCIAYCHLISHAMTIVYGSPMYESGASSARSSLWLPPPAEILISNLNSARLEDRQVATFLIAKFIAADRYFKLCMSATAARVLTRPAFFVTPMVEELHRITIPFQSADFFPVFKAFNTWFVFG